MENIIRCINTFASIQSVLYVYMKNHDYPRVSYMVVDYYKNTKLLMKLLKNWNFTKMQRIHISNLLNPILYELDSNFTFLKSVHMKSMDELLQNSQLNLQSISLYVNQDNG